MEKSKFTFRINHPNEKTKTLSDKNEWKNKVRKTNSNAKTNL